MIKLNKMRILTMMQLRDKVDLSFLKDKKRLFFKILFLLIGITVVTAAVYLAFYLGILLGILSLNNKIPMEFMEFLFGIMLTLSLISNVVIMTKNLYFAGDNPILLTYPCPANQVFISKILVGYILELKRNLFFYLPVMLAFGFINNFNFFYYPIVLLCIPVLSLLTVVFGSLFAIPSMFVVLFVRRFKVVLYVLVGVAVSALVLLTVYVISLIPPNIDLIAQFAIYYWKIQDFLAWWSKYMLIFAYLTQMFAGKVAFFKHIPFTLGGGMTFLALIIVIAALIVLVYFLAKPLYFKMASQPFEFNKKTSRSLKKNTSHGGYISCLKKEALMILRSPSELARSISVVCILPIAILLLNKIFASMDTRLFGKNLATSVNILILMLIMLTQNISISSAFSKEGSAIYLLKTKPSKDIVTILSKLSLPFFLSLFSLIITTVILDLTASLAVLQTVFLFFSAFSVNVAFILWSAELDIVNPQYKNYTDGEAGGPNPNETKSTVLAFLIAFLFFGVSLFLLLENAQIAFIKIFFIGLLFLAARVMLFISRCKVHFRRI